MHCSLNLSPPVIPHKEKELKMFTDSLTKMEQRLARIARNKQAALTRLRNKANDQSKIPVKPSFL